MKNDGIIKSTLKEYEQTQEKLKSIQESATVSHVDKKNNIKDKQDKN